MSIQAKLAALEEIMELDEDTLTPSTCLSTINKWDSLAVFSY